MILAIDPGPEKSAWVEWDGIKVNSFGIDDNHAVGSTIHEYALISSQPGRYGRDVKYNCVAIEKIASYGMAVGADVFETCVWTGRFMERWFDNRGDGLFRIPRLDIKVHLCKSARAKDANVRAALIDRFGAPGTKKAPGPLYGITSHCWSALAVAVVAHDRIAAGVKDAA